MGKRSETVINSILMRELTRSDDPVLISYLRTELARSGIESVLLDGFGSSVLAPMNVTAMPRLMVDDDDYWDAWVIYEMAEDRITEDPILGGRMKLLQPVDGFRVAIDPVMLAACVPIQAGDRVLDVGTGTGAAAFALLAREPFAWVTGVDIQSELVVLARHAAIHNGVEDRATFIAGDIAGEIPALSGQLFDHVISNPPYIADHTGRVPKNPARARATIESTTDLLHWISFKVRFLRDGGTFAMIHRDDRLDEVLEDMGGNLGDLKVLELFPMDDGRSATRCLVTAVKGAERKPEIRTRLTLHNPDGSFTDTVQAILRDAAPAPILTEEDRTS